nr:retrovirus-related Pol polyprotein from transposon TNT 1-94 [Tanacetum cinerariifolium]
KTPYELLPGRTPSIGFMRPFGCLVTILNTLDPLGKFNGKVDEGFLVGYSINSKAFRVFNSKTRIVQETLHINFLENKPNVAGSKVRMETVYAQQYVLLPIWSTGLQDPHNTDAITAFDVKENENEAHVSLSRIDKTKKHDEKAKREAKGKSHVGSPIGVRDLRDAFEEFFVNSTNRVNVASAPVTVAGPNPTNSANSFNTTSPSDIVVSPNFGIARKSSFVDPFNYPDDPEMPALEDIVYSDYEEDVGEEPDFSNLETNISVSPIPTTRVHKDHPVTQIIGDWTSAPQTRCMARMVKEQGGLNQINDEDFHTYLVHKEAKRRHFASSGLCGLQVKQKDDGIFISQDKYVAKILRKFGFTDVKSANTPIKTDKPLLKDPDGEDVDVHIYRSMIGSLMYLTSSRPDIVFVVCACA